MADAGEVSRDKTLGGDRRFLGQLRQDWFVDGGTVMYYLEGGAGRPVVFLHGGASTSHDWIPVMGRLSGGYRVLAPDMPGFGRSIDSKRQYRISDFAWQVANFVEKTCRGPIVLVGHSLGGRVAVELASGRPTLVERLVLVDAAGLGELATLGYFIIRTSELVRRCCGRPKPYPDFDPLDIKGNLICLEKLATIKQPAMLIWGQFDPYYPVSYARRAVAMMPTAQLEILTTCRHAPHKERPGAVSKLLTKFLDGF